MPLAYLLLDLRTCLAQTFGVVVRAGSEPRSTSYRESFQKPLAERLVPDVGKNQGVTQAPRQGRRRSAKPALHAPKSRCHR